jgi:hypothetical protein
MKVAFAISALSVASALSNNAFIASKPAHQPLAMLPKRGPTADKVFIQLEESPSFLEKAPTDHEAALKDAPNHEAEDGSAGVRQLLGIKGASEVKDIWKIRLQLTKVGIHSLSSAVGNLRDSLFPRRSLSRGFHLCGE